MNKKIKKFYFEFTVKIEKRLLIVRRNLQMYKARNDVKNIQNCKLEEKMLLSGVEKRKKTYY